MIDWRQEFKDTPLMLLAAIVALCAAILIVLAVKYAFQ